jgi:ATP-dependent helicase/nuclease subunit A
LLERWRMLAGQLPVHDLLDRIFHEGEVLARYESAFPATLHPRVRASLTRFIELALELDNGRYPSLPRFLDLLNRLRQSEQDQPDENSPDDSQGDRVRLLTVHAAKGLEAPVVFLADAATRPRDRSAYNAVVDWPNEAARPNIILLAGKAARRDSRTAALLEQQATAARCEDANLLYVALTRARQYLFISGSCKPSTRDTGWYGLAAEAMQDCERTATGNPYFHSGTHKPPARQKDTPVKPVAVLPGLTGVIKPVVSSRLIAPSRHSLATQSGHADSDGRTRGIAIHLMLESLARADGTNADSVFAHVAAQLERTTDDAELLSCWTEALTIRKHPPFAPVFDPAAYRTAYNEVPVQYLEQDNMVHGVIDRLVVNDDDILLIDYKTHRHATPATVEQLADSYVEQMRYYTRAVSRLWPAHNIRSGLLFTACAELVWLAGLQSAPETD